MGTSGTVYEQLKDVTFGKNQLPLDPPGRASTLGPFQHGLDAASWLVCPGPRGYSPRSPGISEPAGLGHPVNVNIHSILTVKRAS